MQVERWTGRVTGGPLEDVYVYAAPVRLWHWLTVVLFAVLAVTGYFIGAPPPAIGGEATNSFLFGWIRTIHFVAFLPPLWSWAFWRGLFGDIASYGFLRNDDERWVGHNPLALAGMFFMFTLGMLVLIFTGLGLYSQASGWGSGWMNAFGWVTVLLGTPQAVRTVHHFAMWYVVIFALVHMYMVFRQDIVGRSTIISTMVNGIRMFKGEPRG